MDVSGKRIAIALGGGGARGAAHIGVINELERREARIIAVAGTSMGAVVGAIHGVGRLDEYAEWLGGLTHRDVLRLLDPALRAPGMIAGEKVMSRIRDLVGDVRIEDLPLPYTAVATDLVAGKEVWFQSGPVETAIRASIALPSVFTPLVHEGRVLADGGLLNLVPVTPLAAVHADLIVAVSVGGPPRGTPGRDADDIVESARRRAQHARDMDMLQRIRARLGWERTGEAPNEAESQAPVNVRTLDVMELSLQAMQRMITRYQMANYPADVVIELPADACGTMEFHRARELMALGREAAIAVLDAP